MSSPTHTSSRSAPPTASPAAPAATPASWLARLRPHLLPAIAAMVIATVVGVLVLNLWDANLRVPFFNGGDEYLNMLVIKGMLAHGWWWTNSNLGAPFGQELYDYPVFSGDTLPLVIVRLIGIPFSNAAVVINLFFLLGFPLISGIAYFAFRRLGLTAGVAVLCAVLFTSLPYRFERGEFHLFLSSYFTIPIGCLLVYAVLSGRELFRREPPKTGVRAYLSRHNLLVVGACLIMGTSDNYYASYTAALLLIAALLTFIAQRRPRVLIGGLLAAVIVAGTVGVQNLPTIVYTSQHGKDALVGTRLPQESDTFGLTFTGLVMPIAHHRIAPLASLATNYTTTAPAGGGTGLDASLGIVGAAGLCWLLLLLAARALDLGGVRRIDPRYTRAGVGAATAVVIGTVGGLSTLFAYTVSPQLRAPARIEPFIAFFALFGSGLLLDALGVRLGARTRGRAAFAAILVGVLVLGVLDQTSPSMIPNYRAADIQTQVEKRFVAAVQHQLPANASVFELPYVPFPESADVGGVGGYDEAIGFLYSNTLRWSFGGIQGRPSDWEASVVNESFPLMLAEVSAAGFGGIYVDTLGYADRGAALVAALTSATGSGPTVVSSDGRMYFFNLGGYNARLRAQYPPAEFAAFTTAALYPPALNFGAGFLPQETLGDKTWHWAIHHQATLDIQNPSKGPQVVKFSATGLDGYVQPSHLVVRYPNGDTVHTTVRLAGTPLSETIRLSPGDNLVRFSSDAPLAVDSPGDTRRLYFQIANASVTAPTLCLPLSSATGSRHTTACAAGPTPQLTAP